MRRTRHELPKVALIFAALVACGGPTAPTPPPAAVVTADAAPPPVVVIDAAAPKPPPRAHRDCALKPGEISDDETPTIVGAGNSERALDWLAAHGVPNADAIKWYVTRTGHGLDAERAEISLGEARCFDLSVNGEAGIVCEAASTDLTSQVSVLALMVRNKKPVAVLDVGIGLVNMDFPSVHGLDLAAVFADGGKSLELRDRARDGSELVAPPSECEAHEKMLDECAERLASGQGDTKLCPITTDPKTGKQRLITEPSEFHGPYPMTTHDCAGAKKLGAESLKESGPETAAQIRGYIAYVSRSCAARGKYTWVGGRYVKQ